MKTTADKHRRDVNFSVGDWVFLKLRPHRQQSVVKRIHQKLSARYYGPFLILSRIGPAAYKLQLPDASKIHPVFHASLLKKAIGNAPVEPTLPPGFETDPSQIVTPVKCLATRSISKDGITTPQWLIQWPNTEDATWENVSDIRAQFPDFELEDKPLLQDAGIDKEQPTTFIMKPKDNLPKPTQWKVYQRRGGMKGQDGAS
ncbi:uncharacterized protein [Rutidosis leptorrhynchoides]|uniref:uncharacterized protein n=1 Tax=Rutidosis leptorrhynchoides TaxID=125765 RepID=UPI003A9A1EE2